MRLLTIKNLLLLSLVFGFNQLQAQSLANSNVIVIDETSVSDGNIVLDVNHDGEAAPTYKLNNKTKFFLYVNTYRCDDYVHNVKINQTLIPPCTSLEVTFQGFTDGCPANVSWTQATLILERGSNTTSVVGDVTAASGKGSVKVEGKVQAGVTNVYDWSRSQTWENSMKMVAGYNTMHPKNIYSYGGTCPAYDHGN
jgi:hypothetical protein